MRIFNKAIFAICFFVVASLLMESALSAEKIVLKDGKVLYGKIKRRVRDTVWVDIGAGNMGYIINKISFIYNDDGTISKYSPKSEEEAIAEVQKEFVSKLSELRNLPAKDEIESDELTQEEIKNFCFERIKEHAPKDLLSSEEKVLKKLKLAPSDFDYVELFEEFARREVAGFYDVKDKKMYISMDVPKQLRHLVIPHELVHALQDQNFDLEKLVPKIFDNSDLVQARTALIEGDATITSYDLMFQSKGMNMKDMPDISSTIMEAIEIMLKRDEAFSRYPTFLQEQIMFPYFKGGSFVHKVLQNYSYQKLNEIFEDPPSSTEQILHIDKYLFKRDYPVPIDIGQIEAPDNNWKKFYSNVWGEYSIYSFLKQHNEILFSKVASEGWDGDNLVGFENVDNGDIILVWGTVWDAENDAREFYDAYTASIKGRYDTAKRINEEGQGNKAIFDCGPEGCVYIEQREQNVLVIESAESQAPNEELIISIWEKIVM